MRTCQIFKNGKWTDTNFAELKKDDIFRLFDDDIPAINNDGFTQFMAQSDAYENDKGIYQVDIMDSICSR